MGKRQIKKEHFANLLAIANADGILTSEEIDFLATKAIDYGLEDSEVKELLDRIDQLQFVVPMNKTDREQQLTDAIYLTMIDGNIDQREYQLCLRLAEKLDLSKTYLDHLIALVKELWENEDKAKI